MEFKKPAAAFTRHIGKTTFNVNCYFNPEAKMSFEDRLLRMIRHAAMDKRGNCAIIEAPQMSRQSERSA